MSTKLQNLVDVVYATYQAGGWVMIPIFLVGAMGFYLLFTILTRVGKDFYRRDFPEFFQSFRLLLSRGDIKSVRILLKRHHGLVARHLEAALDRADWGDIRLRNYMAERMMATMAKLDEGMHMVNVMAATAPLLGLLGTVTGMVSTFVTITQYGNSNPVLMADGISEALITTQSGLLIAFPLVLLRHRLEDRIDWIKKQIELGVTVTLNYAYTHSKTTEAPR